MARAQLKQICNLVGTLTVAAALFAELAPRGAIGRERYHPPRPGTSGVFRNPSSAYLEGAVSQVPRRRGEGRGQFPR